jgi:DHA1 family tetracycline resistance protein-like MFS transporter
VAMFLMHMAQFALHATWVLYTGHRYGWGTAQVGYSLFAVGVGAAIVQGGLARRLIPRIGEKRALLVGLIFGVGAYVGYGLATEGWMIYVILGVASLGGLAPPAAQALITRAVKSTEQGEVQGALTGLQSVAGIIGPIIGGTVFHYSLTEGVAGSHPGMTFFASAAMAGLGWIVAAWAIARARRKTSISARAGTP